MPKPYGVHKKAGERTRLHHIMSKPNPPPQSKHFDKERDVELARRFLKFNDKARSPFHAVQGLCEMLSEAGFEPLKESDDWHGRVKCGGRYFVARHQSSLIAFCVGSGCSGTKRNDTANASENHFSDGGNQCAFSIVAAHTDSPCFKVKPLSAVSAHGYLQLGVECYGGGLWHTWFDRDLTVAGRVMVRTEGKSISSRLVTIDKPILQIPNIAIHLSRNVNTEGFKVNKETDTVPILATHLASTLNSAGTGELSTDDDLDKRHPPLLLRCLAQELDISAQDIVDVDLCVADTQAGAIGGALDEFVMAPRLDNLASCFCGINSLIDCVESSLCTDDSVIRIVACFDHEEVGSRSVTGADSSLLPGILRRISKTLSIDYDRAMARGLLVSADMAHAVHPNYAMKHEARHRPALGGGIVIKTNQNQRYATSGLSGFLVREVARLEGGLPVQEYVVPNDKPCGSTVGPFLASHTGIMTVDVGQPQLAMHSIREMCSVHDFYLVIKVLKGLLEKHTSVMEKLEDGSSSLI